MKCISWPCNIVVSRLPSWVERFTHSFLQGRSTQLSFGGYTSPQIPTPTGIPQGSSLSPILYLYFTSNLLIELKRGSTFPLGVTTQEEQVRFSKLTKVSKLEKRKRKEKGIREEEEDLYI